MRIVLGLGNDGARYRSTRHNVGFMVCDVLRERTGGSFERRGVVGESCWTAETAVAGVPVVLAKPTTLMNGSGHAAVALLRRYKRHAEDLIVVFDDADLPLGRLRLRADGGTGGHNGIRSIIELTGVRTFVRLKIGIHGEGRSEADLADYVLRPFLPDERGPVAEAVSRAADVVEAVIRDGFDAAARDFNGKPTA